MKCEKCKKKLTPYLLKQAQKVDGKLVFEVECYNCRSFNTISKKYYFRMRKDWEMPRIAPINNKLPSEMNVMIVSMGRCGISYIIFHLNQYHEEMFGKSIPFPKKNREMSPVIATRDRFPVPEGWCNVYDIDPRLLLKKPYDRILIVHRSLDIFMKVYAMYYPIDLGEDQKERFREKHKKDYEKVYGHTIDDPRVLRIDLDDLTNYTVDTFKLLMDFFNFPEMGRPPVLPIKPPGLRNWEAYSSLLRRGQPLSNTLQRIASNFSLRDGLLEYMGELKNLKIIPLNKVLIIGPRIHKGCHFSENIYYAFQEKGYDVQLLPLEEMGYRDPKMAIYKEKRVSFLLSKALEYCKEKPDLVLIDEAAWYFYHDLDIPVFYFHREFKRPPVVYYPDVAFFWHYRFAEYFKRTFAPHWAANIPKIEVMDIAFNTKDYKPKKKQYKGITLIAGRESLNNCIEMNELTAVAMLYQSMQEIQKVIKMGIRYIEDPQGGLTDERFREVLPQCEATWIQMPIRQFVSRRILEAMACKVLCIIKIENDEHEDILFRMGFQNGVHYIKIDELEELKELNSNWDYSQIEYMIENAYDVVINNHTYKHRVDFIVQMYQDWMLRSKGVMIE